MRIRWCLPLVLALSAPSVLADAKYTLLPTPLPVETGDKIEVREFFWYGCPHCYALEPYLERWLAQRPTDVAYVRTPGVARRWLPHARAYYTFEALGVTEKVHRQFFDAIHAKGRSFDDEASLVDFLGAHGVDAARVRKVYGSFGVDTQIEKAKQLNFRYGVDSVPMITVDGRYKTDVVMAGGPDQLLTIIDRLIELARQARK